jgi:hypothetical protein
MYRTKTTDKLLETWLPMLYANVVALATHGEVLLIEEAKTRETPETHSRMGMSIL